MELSPVISPWFNYKKVISDCKTVDCSWMKLTMKCPGIEPGGTSQLLNPIASNATTFNPLGRMSMQAYA